MTDNVTLPGTGSSVATDDIGGIQYQRVKPSWGSDGSAVDVDATNPLPTSTNASIFRFSTNNSSTVQLAASATFTGVIETALDQPSVSILMTSDQPMTVSVQQFIDSGGTFAATPLTYYSNANQGLAVSVPLNGNYVRVTATNTGTATTTTFNLNVAYGSLPSTDNEGRMPVSLDDCQPLLSTTLTTTGVSSSIDTLGYQAIVIQLSGVWQGNLTAEGSNTGLTGEWDGLMVHSRDNPALVDIITQGGLYTIRPAGRYLRLNVTSLVGSIKVVAIGRAGSGIDAGDYISLAMDANNNMPLNVALLGVGKSPDGAMQTNAQMRTFSGTANSAITFASAPCADMTTITGCVTLTSGSGSCVLEGWFPGIGWFALYIYTVTSALGAGLTTTLGVSPGQATEFSAPLCGAQYVRIRATAVSTGPVTAFCQLTNTTVFSPASVSTATIAAGTNAIGDVGIQYRANATGAASIKHIVSAATTNATNVKASAGRVVGWSFVNTTASLQYVKLHNTAGTPTAGSGVVQTIAIPANGVNNALGFEGGIGYATGIGYTIVTGSADADATATTAGSVVGDIFYA